MRNFYNKKALRVFFISFFVISGQLFAQHTFYKTFDGAGNDVGMFVTNTADGGYAIIGKTNSFRKGYDVWLLRTDTNGDTLWTKTYGGEQDDEGNCIRQTSDGGFIVAGRTKSIQAQGWDGWIFKTDKNGTKIWEHTFGNNLAGDNASFILPVSDSTYLISGTKDFKSYVFKISDYGNIGWEHTYFSSNNSGATAISPIAGKRYAVVGDFQVSSAGNWYPNLFIIEDNGDLVTRITWTQYAGGTSKFTIETPNKGMLFGGAWSGAPALMQLNSSGTDVWEYIYPEAIPNTYMNSAVATPDGNFVAVGNWRSGAMAKINNSSGDTMWTHNGQIENKEDVFFTCVQETSDNHLILTGYGNSDASDHQIFLLKTDDNGSMTAVNQYLNKIKQAGLMQNTPNPFSFGTTLNFSIPNNDFVELYISDELGKRVKTLLHQQLSSGTYHIQWDGTDDFGSDCSSGVYYSTMQTKSGIIATRKVVKVGHKN